MQYVRQTSRAPKKKKKKKKKRFGEHDRTMNKPNKMISFCICILNVKVTPPLIFWVSQWKKITYDVNSTSRFKIIKIHETDFNGLNFCKHHIHWDIMAIYIMKVIFRKCRSLMFSLYKSFVNVQLDHME